MEAGILRSNVTTSFWIGMMQDERAIEMEDILNFWTTSVIITKISWQINCGTIRLLKRELFGIQVWYIFILIFRRRKVYAPIE